MSSISQSPCWLAISLVAASSTSAQWAALGRDAGSEIHTQAFHVLATANGRVHAFSAMHPSWLALGQPHTAAMAPAVRTGDWTGLIRLSASQYRAYSARLHAYADVAFVDHPDQIQVCVEDDIILILGHRVGSADLEACAYSAQTNSWAFQPMPGSVRGQACSRFVAGVIRGDNVAFAFSARRARWVPTPCGATASLVADGNVLACNDRPPAAVYAFSGVRGSWVASPAQAPASVLAIDHNVAFLRADGPLGARRCAYSAYDGEWITSSTAAGTPRLTDNLVLVEQAGTPAIAPTVAAFGARPGAWNTLALPRGVNFTVATGDDWAVVDDRTSRTLHGVSGVASGVWVAQASYGAVSFPALSHSSAAMDTTTTRAFSGPRGVFADPKLFGSGLLIATTGGGAFYSATERYAYSARHGAWVAGPPRSGTNHFLTPLAFVADYAVATGEVALWHERRNLWISMPVTTGGALTASSSGTNLILLDFTGIGQGVVGVSGQRGDAVAAGGVVGPLLERRADENVGWVRDAADVLHAFASPDATHSCFQYPLDSEFQILTDRVVVPCKIMLRGEADAAAYLAVGLRLEPPSPIPGLGTLFCSPIVVPFAGMLDSRGLLPAPYELPLTGHGAFELCVQGITVGTSGVRLIGASGEPVPYH